MSGTTTLQGPVSSGHWQHVVSPGPHQQGTDVSNFNDLSTIHTSRAGPYPFFPFPTVSFSGYAFKEKLSMKDTTVLVQETARSRIRKPDVCVPASGNLFPLSRILLEQRNGDLIVFTFVAFLHVRTQPQVVRTGTGVLGRVGRDLGCRKTQVLAASIGLGAKLTGIWSCSRVEQKTQYFSNDLFLVLGKETAGCLRRLLHSLN